MTTMLARSNVFFIWFCSTLCVGSYAHTVETVCANARNMSGPPHFLQCWANVLDYKKQNHPEECQSFPSFFPVLDMINPSPEITRVACDVEEISSGAVRARLHNVLDLLNRCKESELPLFAYFACCDAEGSKGHTENTQAEDATLSIEEYKVAFEFLLSTAKDAGDKYCGELVIDAETRDPKDLHRLQLCLLLGDFQEGCDFLEQKFKGRPGDSSGRKFEGCGSLIKDYIPTFGGCVKSLASYTRKYLRIPHHPLLAGLYEVGILPEELKPKITEALQNEPSSICGVDLPGGTSSEQADLLINDGSECPNPVGDAMTAIKGWQSKPKPQGPAVIVLAIVVVVCLLVAILLFASGRFPSLRMGVSGGPRVIDDKAIELAPTTRSADMVPHFSDKD